MKKLLLTLGLFLSIVSSSFAQNTTCSDRPTTDVSNACANTRFVARAVGGGSGTVSLTEFGGKCDGTTDDGPAAQLAHNTGKRVIYPKGICYIATPVTLTTGYFQAQGQGPRVTTILTKAAPMPSGTSPGVPVSWNAYSLTGMSGVYFDQMTIDGNTVASTNPTTNTLSDTRVPIEIIDSFNIYFDNMEFTNIKAPTYNYTVPGLSTTLIPQLKTGQFWIASATGDCKNVTILNTRIKYPTFVEGGHIINCQHVWVDNFRSFDDSVDLHRSLSTPMLIFGPLSSGIWITNSYIKDHLGSAMNLGASALKVTGNYIIGPTLYTQAMPGFPLTVSTTNGSPTTTITTGNCGGLTHVSVGQKITGSGVPAATTVASCVGTTMVLSANATATAAGVVVTLGSGTGPTDAVRYAGGIDSGAELTTGLFTDQGPVTDLEFTGNTIYGVRDACIAVGDSTAAVGTLNYSKVVIADNVCYDVPTAYRVNGTDGGAITGNYANDTLAYAQDGGGYFTGPFEGWGINYANSKRFNIHSNSINGGTTTTYVGQTASPLKGVVTVDINDSMVSGNSVRDYFTNSISATTTVNNTGSDLRFINNAFHGTPTFDIVAGETGLSLTRAEIANNTHNGAPVLASQASVFIVNLDGVPLGGLVGAEAIRAVPLATAVNRVNITGAATGSGPTIASAGSDTDVDLNLATQGAGIISSPVKVLNIGPGGTTASNSIIGIFNGANAANGGGYFSFSKNLVGAKAWAIGHDSAITGGGSTSDSLLFRSGSFGTVATMTTAGLTTFAGATTHTGATTLSAALTYGGVTLNNAVSGTGNMALTAGTTFTGTTAVGTLAATTINAFTLAGTIAGGGQQLNNIIIGTSTPLAAKFTTLTATTLPNTSTTSSVCYDTGTGVLSYNSTVGTCTVSDERLKNFSGPITGALAKVLQIHGLYYTWKDPKAYGTGRQIGVGAQAVEKVFPELVQTDSKGNKSADYQRLVAPIIEALRELKADNDNLRMDILALQAKVGGRRAK